MLNASDHLWFKRHTMLNYLGLAKKSHHLGMGIGRYLLTFRIEQCISLPIVHSSHYLPTYLPSMYKKESSNIAQQSETQRDKCIGIQSEEIEVGSWVPT